MADNGDTGAGVTVAFSSGFTGAKWKEIDAGAESRGAIDDTYLASTAMTYMPGDLPDYGEFTATFFWDQSFSTFPSTTAPGATMPTATITYGLKSGESTPATLAGTCIVTNVKRPTSTVGGLQMGELTCKWDGKTGPAYTAGS